MEETFKIEELQNYNQYLSHLLIDYLKRPSGRYYIYYHIDPQTLIPMYVGKGSGNRSQRMDDRSKEHKEWIKELKEKGLKPIIAIGNRYFDEDEAYTIERSDIHVLKSLNPFLLNKKLNDHRRENGNKLRPIICTTTGEAFPSIVAAAEKLQIRSTSIGAVLKGRQNVTKNLSFRYIDEKLNQIGDKKRKQSAINKKYQCAKAIVCNETDEIFTFIREAAKKLDVCDSYLSEHLSNPNKIKHVKGFTFRKIKNET